MRVVDAAEILAALDEDAAIAAIEMGFKRRAQVMQVDHHAFDADVLKAIEHAVDLLTGSADGLKLFESAARIPA